MKVSLVQMNSISDKAANIAAAETLIERAAREERPDWVLLPEFFDWAGGSKSDKRANAETLSRRPGLFDGARPAVKHGIFVHAGSIMEQIEGEERIHNTSVVFNREGEEIARYRKIHLFDVTTPDGADYRESQTVSRATRSSTYDCEGVTIGCSICYDLRFPDLFQALAEKGAQMIALPAAFTLQTGKDHWEVLLRARAIETETYVCASAQTGSFTVGNEQRHTYGHSLVADPWGHVVAKASDGVGLVSAPHRHAPGRSGAEAHPRREPPQAAEPADVTVDDDRRVDEPIERVAGPARRTCAPRRRAALRNHRQRRLPHGHARRPLGAAARAPRAPRRARQGPLSSSSAGSASASPSPRRCASDAVERVTVVEIEPAIVDWGRTIPQAPFRTTRSPTRGCGSSTTTSCLGSAVAARPSTRSASTSTTARRGRSPIPTARSMRTKVSRSRQAPEARRGSHRLERRGGRRPRGVATAPVRPRRGGQRAGRPRRARRHHRRLPPLTAIRTPPAQP